MEAPLETGDGTTIVVAKLDENKKDVVVPPYSVSRPNQTLIVSGLA